MGELLDKVIPWILPAVMVASFMVNHKTTKNDGKSGKSKQDLSTKSDKSPTTEDSNSEL